MNEEIKFSDLGISSEILKAVEEMGYVHPSPIQAMAIPHLLEGRDVIGQAQTGTGKTAAFSIPMLNSIDPNIKQTQVLVLCPTRELAIQVSGEVKKLSKYLPKVNSLPIYGGDPIDKQIRALKRGVQIVVGTPGRVIDHINRGTLWMDEIRAIVLDEADEMLDMGFREDIEEILSKMQSNPQTVFFSATMAKPIMDLTRKYQKNPEIVKVIKKELTVSNIEQTYYEVKDSLKLELMTRLIDLHNLKLMLVFCNTKRGVDEVTETLISRGYGAEALHGDLSQAQRNRVMSKFRTGNVNILVATDVAARGIDVDNVDGVFNYDLPLDEEYYVHRIGRTGRAGRSGKAISFITGQRESRRLREIEAYTKSKIERKSPPSVAELIDLKRQNVVNTIKTTISKGGDMVQYKQIIEEMIFEGLDHMTITASLLKMIVGESSEQLEDISFENKRGEGRERSEGRGDRFGREGRGDRGRDRDRGPRADRSEGRGRDRDRGGRSDRGDRGGASRTRINTEKMGRLFINVGKSSKIRPGDIVGAIAGETGLAGNRIGEIDIFDSYTFVDVPMADVDNVLRVMNKNQIKGKTVNVEFSKEVK